MDLEPPSAHLSPLLVFTLHPLLFSESCPMNCGSLSVYSMGVGGNRATTKLYYVSDQHYFLHLTQLTYHVQSVQFTALATLIGPFFFLFSSFLFFFFSFPTHVYIVEATPSMALS
ncbi:hypothetical protein BGZ63DRAFT_394155 [Mariannaea sp. PMI_226]|nr:hypothetical protein BGZ63DRAFT_394155 [Mariannaea sp. PMI_226]